MERIDLLRTARNVAEYNTSPYRKSPTGAAVLTDRGTIGIGIDETTRLGISICAEKAAILEVIGKQIPIRIKMMAIVNRYADPADPDSLIPCRSCLMTMSEFVDPDTEIIIDGLADQVDPENRVDGAGVFSFEELASRPTQKKSENFLTFRLA